MPLLSLLAFFLLCLSCASRVRAGEPSTAAPVFGPTVWSGLVLATNEAHPSEPPQQLRRYAGQLRNIFGYNRFELIGESSQRMSDPYERWLIPSKEFFLSVKPHNAPGEHHGITVVFFQNRRRLAEFESHLSAESPLFIRGPMYARGQLVIVLHVVDPTEVSVRGH